MKKIKITEKQAKLLEMLNSKKVLKVTKEQYNRIIESELNRPSLTETPELHEEEINEELFREFINELYGMNEEGKELRFEKLTKVMEAAGLIEGGKLLKEKFGKDTKKVKEVISKGLMKLKECGSVYEAVQCMEESLTDKQRSDIEASKVVMNKEFEPMVNAWLEKNPEQDHIKSLANKGDYVMAYKLMRNVQNSLKEEMELDEREHLGGKRAVGLDILNVPPFSELPETRSDMGDYKTRMELKLPSLTLGDASEIIFSKADLIGSEFQGPKMVHKNPGYIKIFKSKFGSEPVFVNITDKGADIDENLSPKFRDWKESYINAKSNYLSGERNKGKTFGLDEMDTVSVGNMSYEKPLFTEEGENESEITDKIYEALKKKVVAEMDLSNLGNYQYATPGFEDVDMKGNHETGKGKTFKKPAIKGGEFVEINKKCKKFPYCNQGEKGAVKLKNKA